MEVKEGNQVPSRDLPVLYLVTPITDGGSGLGVQSHYGMHGQVGMMRAVPKIAVRDFGLV